MRKKILGYGIMVIVIGVLIASIVSTRATSQFTHNEPLSTPIIGSRFYYDLMDEFELKIYYKISEKADSLMQGLISLDRPISESSFFLIRSAIVNSGQDWFFLNMSPLGEEMYVALGDVHHIVVRVRSSDTNMIDLVTLDDGPRAWMFIEGTVDTLYAASCDTVAYFEQVIQQTNDMFEYIVSTVPPGSGKIEAFKHFAYWIMRNMSFDYEIARLVNSWDDDDRIKVSRRHPIIGLWPSSILEDKVLCGGLATIMMRLCNMVGIEAHIVYGRSRSPSIVGYHAWVSVRIGDQTLYVDPTELIHQQEIILRNRRQMERRWIFSF